MTGEPVLRNPIAEDAADQRAAAWHSLAEAQTTLRSHYDQIREGFLGHTGLDRLTTYEEGLNRVRAEIRLVTRFAQHLPAITESGDFETWSGKFYRDYVVTDVPDLATAKMVESHGVYVREYYGRPIALAYPIGERPASDSKKTWLLLVTPPSKGRFTYYDETETEHKAKVRETPPKLYTALVKSSDALDLQERSQQLLYSNPTDEQIHAMRNNRGGFTVPAASVYPTELLPKGSSQARTKAPIRTVAPSRAAKSDNLGGNEVLSEVGPQALREGLAGWGVSDSLVKLSVAFGKEEELKQLFAELQAS